MDCGGGEMIEVEERPLGEPLGDIIEDFECGVVEMEVETDVQKEEEEEEEEQVQEEQGTQEEPVQEEPDAQEEQVQEELVVQEEQVEEELAAQEEQVQEELVVQEEQVEEELAAQEEQVQEEHGTREGQEELEEEEDEVDDDDDDEEKTSELDIMGDGWWPMGGLRGSPSPRVGGPWPPGSKQEPEPVPEDLSPELQHGFRILADLMAESNRSFNWIFMEDSGREDLPDYKDVVVKPIGLSKIKSKLVSGQYADLTVLVSDLRLMLENCYRYFGPYHSRTKKGLRLEQIMEQKLALLPIDLRAKCTLEATSGLPIESEAEAHSQQHKHRRRSSRSSTQDLSFFSHVLYRVRDNRAERDRESKKKQQDMKRQQREDKEKEILTWEETLLKEPILSQMRLMWELPQIGHFIFITLKALNINEVPQFELERILLMPQASRTLSMLMTALLSSPNVRAKLDKLPSMPYSVWTRKLAGKFRSWYRIYYKENRDKQKMFDTLGLEPMTWDMLGEVNPLDQFPFHELPFHKRVWILKALCDFLLHKHKTIAESVAEQPLADQRSYILGTDRHENLYLHFPQFCGQDLRIYRQSRWVENREGLDEEEAEEEEARRKSRAGRRRKRKRKEESEEEDDEEEGRDDEDEEEEKEKEAAAAWEVESKGGRLTRLQMRKLLKKSDESVVSEGDGGEEKKRKKKKKKKHKRRKKDRDEEEGEAVDDASPTLEIDGPGMMALDIMDSILDRVVSTVEEKGTAVKEATEEEVVKEEEGMGMTLEPGRGHFQLVVDSVDGLRIFLEKFQVSSRERPSYLHEDDKWRRPRCEAHLERSLENLLQELEPWEAKLAAATRRLRCKLYREYEDYNKRDSRKPDPAEEVWCRTFEADDEDGVVAPIEPVAKKEVVEEPPPLNSVLPVDEEAPKEEDEEPEGGGLYARRLRKRKAKENRKVIDWDEDSNDSSDTFELSSWSKRKMKKMKAEQQQQQQQQQLKNKKSPNKVGSNGVNNLHQKPAKRPSTPMAGKIPPKLAPAQRVIYMIRNDANGQPTLVPVTTTAGFPTTGTRTIMVPRSALTGAGLTGAVGAGGAAQTPQQLVRELLLRQRMASAGTTTTTTGTVITTAPAITTTATVVASSTATAITSGTTVTTSVPTLSSPQASPIRIIASTGLKPNVEAKLASQPGSLLKDVLQEGAKVFSTAQSNGMQPAKTPTYYIPAKNNEGKPFLIKIVGEQAAKAVQSVGPRLLANLGGGEAKNRLTFVRPGVTGSSGVIRVSSPLSTSPGTPSSVIRIGPPTSTTTPSSIIHIGSTAATSTTGVIHIGTPVSSTVTTPGTIRYVTSSTPGAIHIGNPVASIGGTPSIIHIGNAASTTGPIQFSTPVATSTFSTPGTIRFGTSLATVTSTPNTIRIGTPARSVPALAARVTPQAVSNNSVITSTINVRSTGVVSSVANSSSQTPVSTPSKSASVLECAMSSAGIDPSDWDDASLPEMPTDVGATEEVGAVEEVADTAEEQPKLPVTTQTTKPAVTVLPATPPRPVPTATPTTPVSPLVTTVVSPMLSSTPVRSIMVRASMPASPVSPAVQVSSASPSAGSTFHFTNATAVRSPTPVKTIVLPGATSAGTPAVNVTSASANALKSLVIPQGAPLQPGTPGSTRVNMIHIQTENHERRVGVVLPNGAIYLLNEAQTATLNAAQANRTTAGNQPQQVVLLTSQANVSRPS